MVIVLGLTGSYSRCLLAIACGIGHESLNNNSKRPAAWGMRSKDFAFST